MVERGRKMTLVRMRAVFWAMWYRRGEVLSSMLRLGSGRDGVDRYGMVQRCC